MTRRDRPAGRGRRPGRWRGTGANACAACGFCERERGTDHAVGSAAGVGDDDRESVAHELPGGRGSPRAGRAWRCAGRWTSHSLRDRGSTTASARAPLDAWPTTTSSQVRSTSATMLARMLFEISSAPLAVGIRELVLAEHRGEERHDVAVEDRDTVLLHRAGDPLAVLVRERPHRAVRPGLPAPQHPQHHDAKRRRRRAPCTAAG